MPHFFFFAFFSKFEQLGSWIKTCRKYPRILGKTWHNANAFYLILATALPKLEFAANGNAEDLRS